jgi:hypothetical protein
VRWNRLHLRWGLIVRLPWWIWLAYADVKFWFVSLPAAVVLAVMALFGDRWLGVPAWAFLAAAALIALPFPAAAALFVHQKRDARRYWRTLDRDQIVAGLPLPARSRIRFAERAHARVVSIDLPQETAIRGPQLIGRLMRWDRWNDIGPVWSGTLAADQWIDGLPCRAGHVAFESLQPCLMRMASCRDARSPRPTSCSG